MDYDPDKSLAVLEKAVFCNFLERHTSAHADARKHTHTNNGREGRHYPVES